MSATTSIVPTQTSSAEGPSSSAGASSGGAGTDGDADIVTQLQTCLGQLTTQFYASVNYISTRHPLSAPIPSQPSSANGVAGGGAGAGAAARPPPAEPTINPVTGLGPENDNAPPPAADPSHTPVAPAEFQAALRELAQDLVTKTRQIEALAAKLPVLGGGGGDDAGGDAEQKRQEDRIRELSKELEGLTEEVDRARKRRDEAKRRIEEVIKGWGSSQKLTG